LFLSVLDIGSSRSHTQGLLLVIWVLIGLLSSFAKASSGLVCAAILPTGIDNVHNAL